MSKARSGKLLFISRSPPYGSGRARALLELSLAAAVFEQDVDMLFLGDGVYQLLRDQDAAAIAAKTLGNALEALPLYGIERPGVEAAALKARGLATGDLVIDVEPLAADLIQRRIAMADTVFNL